MKVTNHQFKSLQEVESFNFPKFDKEKTLIQVFSGFVKEDEINKLQQILKAKDIDFIGVSTAGEILEEKSSFGSIIISVVEFEKAKIKYSLFENKDGEEALGKEIATSMFEDKTKVLITLLGGLTINGED
ncbi:MAG: hypothetical protein GXO62_03420, partial [Epsilonproteobacteria bacterium]|nr:hypothetical protein [Campylobacterota bacterium]